MRIRTIPDASVSQEVPEAFVAVPVVPRPTPPSGVDGGLLLRKLAEGITIDHLLDSYPRTTREDVHAAIQFAADTLAHEEVVFRPTGTER